MKKDSTSKKEKKKSAVVPALPYELLVTGAISAFLISLVFQDFFASLKFFIAYLLLFFIPFTPMVDKIQTSLAVKLLLTHLAGLSYAGAYVLLDVLVQARLSLPIFLAGPAIIILLYYILESRK